MPKRVHWVFTVLATLVVTCLFTLASWGNPGAPRFSVLHNRELLTWLAWIVLAPGVVAVARRMPFGDGSPTRWLARHLAFGVAFAALAMAFVAGVHAAMAAMPSMADMPGMAADAVPSGTADLVSRLAAGVLVYGLIAIAWQAITYRRAAALATRLRADLAEARLAGVEGKLHPHFLFNALNSIAALVREDPAQAESMIEQLGELLHATLRSNPADEVALDEALRLTEQYLAIERVRFGRRLRTQVEATAAARRALVPPFILQPIVENAVRHGIAPLDGGGTVTVSADVDGDSLVLTVDDDGVGYGNSPPSRRGTGLGVSSVRSILSHLYGSRGLVDLRPATPRGTRVTITLPFRSAPA